MRQQIREVMRFAGPRMLLWHPIDTLRHFYKEHQRDRRYARGAKIRKNESGETA
jgi:hypothetical protein